MNFEPGAFPACSRRNLVNKLVNWSSLGRVSGNTYAKRRLVASEEVKFALIARSMALGGEALTT